eukprot:s367_g21.t3
MGALTIWPSFNMQQLLQPQVLRLEEALEEARKAGSQIPNQLQQAILLKCVSGQLRTHLYLAIQEETTTFKELREQVLRWDRRQQKWSSLIFSDESSTAVPMEVDRVYADGRGWNNGKKGDKGKGKGSSGKGFQKGKNKGKTKSKDGKSSSKGKQKSDGKGKSGGKQDGPGKGEGYKQNVVCHNCGKTARYARECWGSSVRSMANDSQVQQNTTAQVSGSPSNANAVGPSNSTTPQTGRVARIQFSDHSSDVQRHDEFVFDLRSSTAHAPDGRVNVVQFYIGDEPQVSSACSDDCGVGRTMLEDVPDDTCMHTILPDSGADASVFPASMSELECESQVIATKLRDAQGNSIPLHSMRDIELHLMDSSGKSVVLQETVAVSSQVSQPILCVGHLLKMAGQSTGLSKLSHMGPGYLYPSNFGTNRCLSDTGTGKHYGNCFQDPTIPCPTLAGRKFRTTLIQNGADWLVMELCEPLDGIKDLAAEFHGYEGDRYIMTILSASERPPQVLGFRLLDDDDVPLAAIAMEREPEQVEIDPAPVAPEDEVVGVEIEVDEQQPADQGDAIPQGNVVLAPERGDHLNVNGVELFKHSSLALLREACSFYNVSQSGSKERCFKRLWEYQKKLELQAALAAAREVEAAQKRDPVPQKLAVPPDEQSQVKHMFTHLPYADWCPHCIAFRARQDAHRSDGSVKSSGIPTISFDFAYTKAVGPGGDVQATDSVAALVLVDSVTNFTGCVPISKENDFDLMI